LWVAVLPTVAGNRLSGRHRGLDLVEEADELLMPVALHVAADHRAIQHVERGEQRGRAVPDVVALGWTAPRHRVPAAWSSQHKQKGRPPWRLSALPWKGPSMSSSCTASFAEREEIALLQA